MGDDSPLFPALARTFFEHCFPRITAKLELDFAGDPVARDLAHDALDDHGVTTDAVVTQLAAIGMKTRRPCIIFAPGPSLDECFDLLCKSGTFSSSNFILAVDGAARLLVDRGARIDAVVTDLDGLDDEYLAHIIHRDKATCFIHCHGNNIDRLNDVLPYVAGQDNCIFTTQVEPTSLVANFGGFTDGDRAVLVALGFGFTQLYLVAMDLDATEIGLHSKADLADRSLDGNPVKREKLAVASAILKWVVRADLPGRTVYTVNKHPPLPYLPDVPTIP